MSRTPFGTHLRRWLRPPRHLLLMFLLTTLGVLTGLGWIGWNLMESDRQDEKDAVDRQLGAAADDVAVELRRNLNAVEKDVDRIAAASAQVLTDTMTAAGLELPEDSILVTFDERSVRAFPPQRLIYYPVVPATDDLWIPPLVMSRAHAQMATDPRGAIELFQSLLQTSDDRIRAEALWGLAQSQTKVGQFENALTTYAALNRPELLVAGRPAELLARIARCQLLARVRTAELDTEAKRLSADLHGGRWPLTRDMYLHYSNEVRGLFGPGQSSDNTPQAGATATLLADRVDQLWHDWQDRRTSARPNVSRSDQPVQHGRFLQVSRSTTERFVALLAGPKFVEARIVAPAGSLLDTRRVRLELEGDGDAPVFTQQLFSRNGTMIRRQPQDTDLPWTINVADANPEAVRASFSTRRALIAGGFGLLAVFVMAGSYLSVRATMREIEAAQMKSDFVAAVSHEFRTPLTLLRQFSDLLAENRVSSDQERRRYYGALQRGTRRLTRLVEDLLDFGRMEAGSRAFTLQPLPAMPWFTALAAEFQEEVRSKGYTLTSTWGAPEHLIVQADTSALTRAVWNLLDNAVKYSPDSQTVWIDASFEEGRLGLHVRDKGIGVALADQRAIFQKFVRGSNDDEGVKGTGLGLALVEQIVQAHGGRVALESAAGEGSTFSIFLPARVNPASQEQVQWRAS